MLSTAHNHFLLGEGIGRGRRPVFVGKLRGIKNFKKKKLCAKGHILIMIEGSWGNSGLSKMF